MTGEDVAALVALDLLGEPARVGPGAYKDEEGAGADGLRGPCGGVLEDEALEPPLPAAVNDPDARADLDVLGGLDLLDQRGASLSLAASDPADP